MCSEGKCCCLKLETGTLIFGVIASVLNSLSVLATIGGMIAFNVIAIDQMNRHRGMEIRNDGSIVYYGFDYRPMIFINIGLFVALVKTALDLTFTVLLCIGVTKRKPSNIRAFFIYGVVMAVLGAIGMLIFLILAGDVVSALLFLVAMIFYSLILHMVNLTYHKINTSGEVYGFDHKRLTEGPEAIY